MAGKRQSEDRSGAEADGIESSSERAGDQVHSAAFGNLLTNKPDGQVRRAGFGLAAVVSGQHCRESRRVVAATLESPLAFPDMGLPNVYLAGVNYAACRVCNDVVANVPVPRELMAAIARALVVKETALTGAEIRFLRQRLEIKAVQFSKLLDVTPQHFSRWENARSVPGGCTDRLIRLTYVFLSGDAELKARMENTYPSWSESIRPIRAPERVVAQFAGGRWDAKVERSGTLRTNGK